jgi:Polyketide cyclase / dehydrase and lipid transport
MATIKREVDLDLAAESAWSELREFSNAAKLFAGVLIDCKSEGDKRSVTFANGRMINERLVTRDDPERRLVYTVLDGSFTQHSASMQIVETVKGCRFVWISDFLPDNAMRDVAPLVDAGCQALARYFAGR